MWTETTQQQYRRDGLRYASDVSDAEWAQIEALLPVPKELWPEVGDGVTG